MVCRNILILVAAVLFCSLASCSKKETLLSEEETTQELPDDGIIAVGNDGDFDPNSQQVNVDNAITITFFTDSVKVNNPFADEGVTVVVTGTHVVATSTITNKELNYVLSGITPNGSLKIYGNYKFGIVLNGVGITNPSGAAVNNQCGKKITVTIVTGTNNRLIDGTTYQYVNGEDMKGTFFSEGQLNFYGQGRLEIKGKNKHAICADDYIRIYEGNIVIKEAASDGIHANDYIQIDKGLLVVNSTGDGLDAEKGYVALNGGRISVTTSGEKAHGVKSMSYTTVAGNDTLAVKVSGRGAKAFKSAGNITMANGVVLLTVTGAAFYDTEEADITSPAGVNCEGNFLMTNGTLTIAASGNGGKGISADGTVTVNGGILTVNTTGGQFKYGTDDTAAKAVKSTGKLTVNGGTINIKTTGIEAEGLESKDSLVINDGNIAVEAYDDCINATKHIAINGGKVYCNSTTNDGIDSNGTMNISGGIIVSAGASAPEEGFDCDNNQFKITGGIMVGIGGATSNPTAAVSIQRSLIYNPTATGIALIRIESTSGAIEALTIQLPRTYTQKMCMLFSSPNLAANTAYTIYTGGSVSGGTHFHGLYTGATYTKGISAGTFTTTSMVTTVGTSNGPGPGPGR